MKLKIVNGRAVAERTMWSVRIHLPRESQPFVLLYNSEEKAREAYFLVGSSNEPIQLQDDFGTQLAVWGRVSAVIFEDIRRGLEGGIKRGLMQAEAQQKVNRQAQAQAGHGIVAPGGMRLS